MKPCWRILAVDDEPLNLEIMRECIDDPRIDMDFAPNAERAWTKLETEAPYSLVILDRFMPGMTGIELLRRMKAEPRYRDIPVIMQTAASSPADIREGIEAGAYYYLTKPYAPEALVAIVRAALADLEERAIATQRIAGQIETLRLIETAEFVLAAPAEAHRLAAMLAELAPAPDVVAMGLTELLINAIEHGNLAITYDEKVQLRRSDTWEDEIRRRLAMAEYSARRVRLRFERTAGRLTFVICDEGKGFDWTRYLDIDPARAFDPSGRGIAMARMLSFASLEYRGCGNEVAATVTLP